ncbi:YpmA family protein [Peptococcaceae bacterium 1198_IL3148]
MGTGEKREPKLELIAHKSFSNYDEMYRVVDFLNRTLKDKNLIFGLTKSDDTITINIYET